MWTKSNLKLLKDMALADRTYAEIAAALTVTSGESVTRNTIAGKISRLRKVGALPPTGRLQVKREKPNKLKVAELDRCVGHLFFYCQWIGSHDKCHRPIGRRYPGVSNYCELHQVQAVAPSVREKVESFHRIDVE